jgi:hypothetical protein
VRSWTYKAHLMSCGSASNAYGEKKWGGAATAMILKACLGVLQPTLWGEGIIDPIPDGTRTQFAKLIGHELWPQNRTPTRRPLGKMKTRVRTSIKRF